MEGWIRAKKARAVAESGLVVGKIKWELEVKLGETDFEIRLDVKQMDVVIL